MPILRTLASFIAIVLATSAVAQEPLSPFDPGTIPHSKYFEVTRPDPRMCPSPICGGVYVRLVNRKRVRCADGIYSYECHAAVVDWSALGLSDEDVIRLESDFFDKRVLARGELELRELGVGTPIPTLVVSDAWRSAVGPLASDPIQTTGLPPRDRHFGVESSGIVCITWPCPSLVQKALNWRMVRQLHEIDLGPSGATDAQIAAGLEALGQDGLIVFGRNRLIEGPAGKGRTLIARDFYIKVAKGDGGPRACGGLALPPNPACDASEFCELPAGSCLIADLPGTCQVVPDACLQQFDPVCGCDGVTYSNDCERQRARVALDHVGACSTGTPCGPSTCGPGTLCCNPLLGICAPPGGFCAQ